MSPMQREARIKHRLAITHRRWHRDHLKLTRELDVARSQVHPSRRHLRSVD